SRVREAKPSAAISSRNPKCVVRNVLDAATSLTLSDTADEVILIEPPGLSLPLDPQDSFLLLAARAGIHAGVDGSQWSGRGARGWGGRGGDHARRRGQLRQDHLRLLGRRAVQQPRQELRGAADAALASLVGDEPLPLGLAERPLQQRQGVVLLVGEMPRQ